MDIKRIHRIGGSYAVVISPRYISALNLSVRDFVSVDLIDNALRIKKLDLAPETKLRLQKKEVPGGK